MQPYLLLTLVIGYRVGSSSAVLNITELARLTDEVTLPCWLETGSATDVDVSWHNRKDGYLTMGTKVLKHKGQISVQKPAPNEWNLHIKRISMSFEDTYFCKADDEIVSYIQLCIENEPKIDVRQSTPISATFDENTTAVLKCVASGTPEPEIKWYRMIGSGYKQELGITGQELIVRNITRYAAGQYMCEASNKIGSDDRSINISVEFAPQVDVMEPEVYAAEGEFPTMHCVVQASPLSQPRWIFGTSNITSDWKYDVIREDANGMPVRFVSLVFRYPIAYSDYGTYTCLGYGKDTVANATVDLKPRKTGN